MTHRTTSHVGHNGHYLYRDRQTIITHQPVIHRPTYQSYKEANRVAQDTNAKVTDVATSLLKNSTSRYTSNSSSPPSSPPQTWPNSLGPRPGEFWDSPSPPPRKHNKEECCCVIL